MHRRHGAEGEQGEPPRHGGRRGDGDQDYYHSRATTRDGPHSPKSPSGRKRRAVAADLFDKDERDCDGDSPRNNATRSGSPSSREHKRQKHHDCRDRDGHQERHRHHHRHSKRSENNASIAPVELPYNARRLSYKHDFEVFTALFAYYLDIQKELDFYSLDSHEARGRWKSFVNKWNSGKLAEGWYEPEMFERITRENPARATTDHGYLTADEDGQAACRSIWPGEQENLQETAISRDQHEGTREPEEDDDDADDYCPPPPPGQSSSTSNSTRRGPGIPSHSDLALQREAAAEAAEAEFAALRLERKADRALQKERLDELVPRAEPGTRERQLEKKALVNEKMRSFREKGDTMEEVGDSDLMGGGDDMAEYKRMLATQQRKKTERELRREAEARAKAVEREARLQKWKEREEEKLKGLKELAKARFG